MDPLSDIKPQGAFSALLADQDLAHLQKVLRRSLSCDLGGPLLPPSYWRGRLAAITRQAHLSHTQIQIVHRLYLVIDAFEAAPANSDADAEGPAPEEPLAASGA
ncbi:hypothetical protein [Caballeronia sp. AZ10_KS36]|uniref:hypothetical protein n=1 Tax=Caballeronia sp. AZ10_KS36 TaxID=2921757 RepID=UPI00202888E9|nr:hypothetical protein [Caballeronia sp. AZ10_KS36]